MGWRQIVEKMYRTASVAEWFRTHGKHPVYAKNQPLDLPARPVSSKSESADGRTRLRLTH